MFERSGDRSRRVVVLAQEEARMLGHGRIGPEHLLLGLIHEESGIQAAVLAAAGAVPDKVRAGQQANNSNQWVSGTSNGNH